LQWDAAFYQLTAELMHAEWYIGEHVRRFLNASVDGAIKEALHAQRLGYCGGAFAYVEFHRNRRQRNLLLDLLQESRRQKLHRRVLALEVEATLGRAAASATPPAPVIAALHALTFRLTDADVFFTEFLRPFALPATTSAAVGSTSLSDTIGKADAFSINAGIRPPRSADITLIVVVGEVLALFPNADVICAGVAVFAVIIRVATPEVAVVEATAIHTHFETARVSVCAVTATTTTAVIAALLSPAVGLAYVGVVFR